jgi:hypothetical protein
MEDDERRNEQPQDGPNVGPIADVYDDQISLLPLLVSVWMYRRVVGVVVAGVMVTFVIVAAVAAVRAPVEQMGTVGFLLLFDDASQGRYPNGIPFSSAEITSTPVLEEVFNVNALDRFGSFEDFQNSLFILQANPELDLLFYEYQTKLSVLGLTAVDRTRIENELQGKRESLTEPQFTLNLRRDNRTARMPPSLVSKVLDDTLAGWARQAGERKGALLYDIPVLSSNILSWDRIESEDYLVGTDILRTQIMRITANIQEISELPGAALIRVGDDRWSLAEARLALEDILRFQIQPLLGMIRATGASKDPGALNPYISSRLFQLVIEREEAQKRVQVVQESLRAYMPQKQAVVVPEGGSVSEGVTFGGQGMIPQLSESFLDRMVEMSNLDERSDVSYRQELTDLVISESLTMAALEREQKYYEEVNSALSEASGSLRALGGEDVLLSANAKLERAFNEVVLVVDQMNAVYEELSTQNLNPSTLLYSVTTPFTLRTERGALPLRTVALYGMLTFILSLTLVTLGCVVHRYFRRDVVALETEGRLGGRALGGQRGG